MKGKPIMSEFKRGTNQRNDYGKRPDKERDNKPAISLVNMFIGEMKNIIDSVNSQVNNIEYSVNDTKTDYGQVSIRVDYMKDGEVKRSVNLYYMENTRLKSGEYLNAFAMITHGSNGAVLFSRFGRADDLIAKLVPYADRIIASNAGIKTESMSVE